MIAAALAVDDLDRAIEAGLLMCERCPGCEPACRASVVSARDARRGALAARERFRARDARLHRRAEERAARRTIATRPSEATVEAPRPALPPAAAAALARAKARAIAAKKQ
ncbi:hypothetical protein [Lysobacter sp. F6437]|uniref:hypothetical protein n=1 Tax=Lysobacter sp. F6437 TaxID=3459296 RepID=UPI00403E15FF